METSRYSTFQCFNPFSKNDHRVRNKKTLRAVNQWMVEHFQHLGLPKEAKVCDSCRKELSTLKSNEQLNQSCARDDPGQVPEVLVSSDSDNDPDFCCKSDVVETLNASLHELGESPLDAKKVKSKCYASNKIKKINSAMKRKLFTSVPDSTSDEDNEILEETVLKNLKDSFSNCASREKKVKLLTCLPKSWSVRKIMREFNAPNYMVRQAKKILNEKGILEDPNPRPGKSLAAEVVATVRSYYESDEISRVCPGTKDCVTVKNENGDKVAMSKRLVLCNLMEAFRSFKDKHPGVKIGFSKFAELRPKNCVLAGSSGTHSVCVCTTHQNLKLMIENTKIGTLTNNELQTYKHCIARTLCNPASIQCHLGECSSCPGTEHIKSLLTETFEEHSIEKVTFRQWISVDRCNLETLEKSTPEFIDLFTQHLSSLVRHDFIAKQQSSFLNKVKENLGSSEYLVMLDFSENYSFVLQDAAQSYHWNNGQATVHPFVIYYKKDNVEHVSFVIISECLEHNTIAVYCFQKKLIEFMKEKFGDDITKIYYFSDGSAAQYKNRKNFTNLSFHKKDFNIEAEWHFSATAHGKSAYDGVGGTVKRLAARASLQRPYDNQIQTPFQLYEWSVQNIFVANFTYVTQQEYIETERQLESRLNKSLTIEGTQKLHAYIPVPSSNSQMKVKVFSESSESINVKVTTIHDRLSISEVSGYVNIVYENNWWLAYVLAKDQNNEEVKVSFLHPAGPSPSFSFPRSQDILWLPISNVLKKVNPITPTGRTYSLTQLEQKQTMEAFEDFSVTF